MLQRVRAENGVVVYQSPILRKLGVPHGFSTRIGGVSRPPFASLNLGNPHGAPVQDDLANIRENYRRLAEAAGCPERQLRRVHQVHGNRVVQVRYEADAGDDGQADALVTDDPKCMVTVRVADCVPVLLASEDGAEVSAVHAGWRGLVAGVVLSAASAMKSKSLRAAIGPCIGPDSFEVGPEVIAEFRRILGQAAPVRVRPDGKGLVDLRLALQLQLQSIGLPADHIDSTDRCTMRDAEEFFSHRRDHGITGRMAAIISPR